MHQGSRDLHLPTNPARAGGPHKGEDNPTPMSLHHNRLPLLTCVDPRFVETFMANTMTFFDSLSMVVSHPKQTIFSSAITLIEESNRWRRSACSSHTRSSIRKTSLSYVAIMSVLPSTVSTASTTNAKGGTISNCGRLLRIALIACQLPPSLTRRSSPCMVGSVPTSIRWNRSVASCVRLT